MACHTRSNSFPSRPHPLFQEVDEHLCRLRSTEATSTSSSSISHKLYDLQDLHDCVDRLLQLPLTQQSLAQEKHEKWASEILDGSVRLLDVCNSAKDALVQIKESMQDLQSIIRRKRGDETGLTTESADNAQNQLNNLESCIQDQEEGLECLFRQLIKTRVSLLNILNH
ncbi:hypothetical protein M0R45_009910 [Rubus argutus]|uniref:Uncharacterized protein n=1 Tax=Rubus argutus TaxID=59490 RepID=A0AAW1Y650_RUBAR